MSEDKKTGGDKSNDSFDLVEEQSDATLSEVLQALREVEAKQEELTAENKRLRSEAGENDEEEEDNSSRRPAETMTLATYKGKPIVDMRLEKNLAKDHNGNTYINNYKAVCEVYNTPDKNKKVTITYGEMSEPDDYLNLPRVVFKLVDQNSADLSGASRVDHNKIITRGEKVDEIDRSSGAPVRTGKQVELVTRNDIRHYTIMVGDEKLTLHQDKIYR